MNNTLNDQDDKLREKALKIICSAGRVTNGLLRARLHIGFNLAQQLIDEFETDGLIIKNGWGWEVVNHENKP
jgi:DNA segregation ATPase FtsK/SpoIIIE-like protein